MFFSGNEAISELKKTKVKPEVILLDIQMPGLSGLDIISSVKKCSPQTRIIILTSYDLDEYIRQAFGKEVSGFLLKISTPKDIIRAIEKSKEGEISLDPEIIKKIVEYYARPEFNKIQYAVTEREVEIMTLVASGQNSGEIGGKLQISPFTVDTRIKNLFRKLKVTSRSELIAKAISIGLIKPQK